MSQRFTPITSDLLARKGEASPSAIKPSLFWRRPPPVEPSRPQPSRDLRAPETVRDLRLAVAEPSRETRDLRLMPAEPAHDLRVVAPSRCSSCTRMRSIRCPQTSYRRMARARTR